MHVKTSQTSDKETPVSEHAAEESRSLQWGDGGGCDGANLCAPIHDSSKQELRHPQWSLSTTDLQGGVSHRVSEASVRCQVTPGIQ